MNESIERWVQEAYQVFLARVPRGKPEDGQDQIDYAAINEIAAWDALLVILHGWSAAGELLAKGLTWPALSLPPGRGDENFIRLAIAAARRHRAKQLEVW